MSSLIIYPEAEAIDRTHSQKVIATKIHKDTNLALSDFDSQQLIILLVIRLLTNTSLTTFAEVSLVW